MEYRDTEDNLRLYYPDFVVLTSKGEHIIIETKGRVDIDVERKDQRAEQWCKDVNRLVDGKWSYIRVNQEKFEEYRFESVRELTSTLIG